MQDMDFGMGMENMENTTPESGQDGSALIAPENPDGMNVEEGGIRDEASEKGTDKAKRRRKKPEEEQPQDVPDDEQPAGNEPEGTEDGMGGEEPGLDEPDGFSPQNADEVTAAPRRERRERGLDSQGRVIYEQGDRGQHDLSILTGARNARRILTATIDGIDTDGNALPRVVFYVGTVKVLIPFSEMGMDLNPDEVDAGEAARTIDSMLGAKIDCMVRGVDAKNRIAGASRRAAMLLRRETILNARQGDDYRVRLDSLVTARILQVFRASMLVEVYGYQTYIRRSAASSLWVNDIREFADVGDEKQVRVVALERDPVSGEVTHMEVSIRGAEDIPHTELRTGNTYTGNITGFSETAYFVRVNGVPLEVRCPINSNNVMDIMGVGDYVKFVVRGIYDGVPTGSVRKIIKKATASIW